MLGVLLVLFCVGCLLLLFDFGSSWSNMGGRSAEVVVAAVDVVIPASFSFTTTITVVLTITCVHLRRHEQHYRRLLPKNWPPWFKRRTRFGLPLSSCFVPRLQECGLVVRST